MSFTYQFPAVRGYQAGREYYIAMIPLKLLSKLFPKEEDVVQPEYRAQRRINESRIPEIKRYILNNRSNYVFSALSASIDGNFVFKPLGSDDLGILEIDMDSIFLINDGQHRKAAIESALEEDSSLGEETISIVLFKDSGLKRSQQMFTDLNKHAVKTSNSLSTLYDSRDEIAIATKDVINENEFLNKYTDKERDILGKNSSKLFTLNTIYKTNSRILHKDTCNDEDRTFLRVFWLELYRNIVEWNELMNKEMTKKELKENYILTLAITIQAFGKLGRLFYRDKRLNIKDEFKKLKTINWERNSENWIGNTIRENGKVMNSEEAIGLTYKKITELMGLEER